MSAFPRKVAFRVDFSRGERPEACVDTVVRDVSSLSLSWAATLRRRFSRIASWWCLWWLVHTHLYALLTKTIPRCPTFPIPDFIIHRTRGLLGNLLTTSGASAPAFGFTHELAWLTQPTRRIPRDYSAETGIGVDVVARIAYASPTPTHEKNGISSLLMLIFREAAVERSRAKSTMAALVRPAPSQSRRHDTARRLSSRSRAAASFRVVVVVPHTPYTSVPVDAPPRAKTAFSASQGGGCLGNDQGGKRHTSESKTHLAPSGGSLSVCP